MFSCCCPSSSEKSTKNLNKMQNITENDKKIDEHVEAIKEYKNSKNNFTIPQINVDDMIIKTCSDEINGNIIDTSSNAAVLQERTSMHPITSLEITTTPVINNNNKSVEFDEFHASTCNTNPLPLLDITSHISNDSLDFNENLPTNVSSTATDDFSKKRVQNDIEINQTDQNPKSCLSRHNSGHTHVKKRVNISTHTEIIELDVGSIMSNGLIEDDDNDDDDDVFSDSMPPPKRESMCAPYIECDIEKDHIKHGLPEWFSDERIHDINLSEPPVTPVGRDELELKRKRLYEDLLRAAHAAVEHSARFSPFLCDGVLAPRSSLNRQVEDCDPTSKHLPIKLEHLVNRLEKLVERLELCLSVQEDNKFTTVQENFDLENTKLPPLPAGANHTEESLANKVNVEALNSNKNNTCQNRLLNKKNNSEASVQTVSKEQQLNEFSLQANFLYSISMSVAGYEDLLNGSLYKYLSMSQKIGGDVAEQAKFVKNAFEAQLQYVSMAATCSQPGQEKLIALLKPTSDQITAVQDYREKHRASPFFNHLSAVSESIPALGWVCVSTTPGPHVKEMNDAGQFYTNRVLKEWKEKDNTHVEWARAWVQTLTELQQYIKQHHTTGLMWLGKGGAPPPPPMGACPPPPPPPNFDLSSLNLEGDAKNERNALFAEINQGEAITKNLKKVTADMQTHKNPTLRTGPAPFKTPTQFGGGVRAAGANGLATFKEPVFMRDGKKWIIEYQKKNPSLLVENAEMNNVVYMFKCEDSTLTVKGKVNNIVMDSCKKCSVLFDSVVASTEFVNCQSVQLQVLGHVPTISIDKTDGCQMYLSKNSMNVEIISSKSSEMNIMLPEDNGDYTELPVPEQFKTTISGKTLKTVCADNLG